MVAQIDNRYFRTHPGKLWSRLVSYALFEGRPLTTRGRWINSLVFAHLALEIRLPQMKSVEAPIFIVGTGRSGTTILGLVLSMHRDVGFLNEPKALWHALYKGEDLIGSYTRGPALYRLSEDDMDSEMRRAAHRLYSAYLTITGTRRVVDKYPELIFRVPFVKALFPDARFIFLARNGWDTCASIKAWSDRLSKIVGTEQHDWWGADGRKWRLLVEQIIPEHADLAPHAHKFKDLHEQRIRAAIEWIVTMREGLRLIRDYPGVVLHIPYEMLCIKPRKTMCRIAEFAGLDMDPTFLRYAAEVLSPPEPRPSFQLPPWLKDPFATTQNALDRVGKASA